MNPDSNQFADVQEMSDVMIIGCLLKVWLPRPSGILRMALILERLVELQCRVVDFSLQKEVY